LLKSLTVLGALPPRLCPAPPRAAPPALPPSPARVTLNLPAFGAAGLGGAGRTGGGRTPSGDSPALPRRPASGAQPRGAAGEHVTTRGPPPVRTPGSGLWNAAATDSHPSTAAPAHGAMAHERPGPTNTTGQTTKKNMFFPTRQTDI